MCGICGYSGGFSTEQLLKANSKIEHRGPDGEGFWQSSDSSVGLGHKRLAIIDLSSNGAQPMVSECGTVVISFNGEIYNYRELAEELEKKGVVINSDSDTEVLLKSYLYCKHTFLKKLNGMFTFSIYDSRMDEMLLARDSSGVKQLYYSQCSNGFSFSSEIKSLICLIGDKIELDPQSIRRYLTYLWSPGESTFLKNVKKLEPGHALIVKRGIIKDIWKWSESTRIEEDASLTSIGSEKLIDKTRDLLQQSVRRQLVSDVPVGAFLSGGLDSSSVVGLAKREVDNLPCFTIDTGGAAELGVPDDLPFAKKVAKYLNVPLEIVKVSGSKMALDIEKMVSYLDEPVGDVAPLNVKYISNLAKESGIKVLLSGAGGDDLFTGYRRHSVASTISYASYLPQSFLYYASDMSASFNTQKSLQRRAAKLFSSLVGGSTEKVTSVFRWMDKKRVDELFLYDVVTQEPSDNNPMVNYLNKHNLSGDIMSGMLYIDQRFFLVDHNLFYTDMMSMSESIEVRVPFLDPDLIKFANSLPNGIKQKGRVGKWVLKKSMESVLPNDVIYREKSGFGGPLRKWMVNELKPLVNDYLSESSINRRGIFSYKNVKQLIDDNQDGLIDAAYPILVMLSIEIWCRKNLDEQIN